MSENSIQDEQENGEQVEEMVAFKKENICMSKDDEDQVENHWSYWDLLYAFAALAICLVFTIPITLIPQHNAILL